jgi:prophage regulatory protein
MTRLIRLPEVRHLTSLSRSQLHRLEAAGRFVMRRKIGDRAVAWDLDEVLAWMASRPTTTVHCREPWRPDSIDARTAR